MQHIYNLHITLDMSRFSSHHLLLALHSLYIYQTNDINANAHEHIATFFVVSLQRQIITIKLLLGFLFHFHVLLYVVDDVSFGLCCIFILCRNRSPSIMTLINEYFECISSGIFFFLCRIFVCLLAADL